MRSLLLVLLAASFAAAGAQAQGTDAQKEKDKAKAGARKPSRSYTDEDLKKARETGPTRGNLVILPEVPADGSGDSSASSSGGESRIPASEEGRQASHDEAGWRDRAQFVRDGVRTAEGAIKEIEDRLGELTSDVAANPGDLMDPSRLQKREAEKYQLLTKLEEAKANLAAARKALTDFEEEARQKNVPAAWLERPPS